MLKKLLVGGVLMYAACYALGYWLEGRDRTY
jgi:hypothetical protein